MFDSASFSTSAFDSQNAFDFGAAGLPALVRHATGLLMIDPAERVTLAFDWSARLGVAQITSVAHTLPAGLEMLGESNDDRSSFVGITGVQHGHRYVIEAEATLSATNPDGSAQVVNMQVVVLGWRH